MKKLINETESYKDFLTSAGNIERVEKQKSKTSKGGYFKMTKKRWFDDWQGLNWTQRSIMTSLWLYGAGTAISWVAMRTIADLLGCDKDTILTNIRKLEKLGYLKTEKRKGRGRYYNVYKLLK